MKRRRTLQILLTLLAFAVACSAQSDVTILDQSGRQVAISQPIDTIVSIHGIGTYYVYSLGGGDRLTLAYYVGVKTLSGASDTMRRWEPRLPELLSFGDPNIEELVASGAQLVLADGTQHVPVAEQLTSLGIPVVLYQAETAEALKDAVSLTGEILGPDAVSKADAFIAEYDRIVDSVSADVSSLDDGDHVRVLFLGTSPTKAISGDMYQTVLIDAAGGRSVTEDLFGAWNEINLEQVLLWNPDVIIIPPYGPVQPADLLDDPDWQALDAIQAGRVHRIPRLIAPMDTPVPESLLCIAWLAKTFYPDLVTIDLAAETANFYREYYQLTLTAEEINKLASP